MSTHEDFEDCPLQNIIRDGGMMNIFRTIGCIGDSLASGEFEYWDNGQKGYWDFYEYSWGKQIERITGISAQEVEYITSDAIENELLYRASLSDKILKEQYCYTDDVIEALREYDGEKLETNAELRALTATLSASIVELVRSKTRMGVVYTWEWDFKPLVRFTDYAAMSWVGTYRNGGSNTMLFDAFTSFAVVYYYFSDTKREPITHNGTDFESDNTYNGAAVSFPAEMWKDTYYY